MSPGLLPQAAAVGAKGIKHVKAGAYTVPASAFLSPAPVDKTAETPEQRAARKAAKAARKADKAAARQGGGDTAVPEAAAPAKKRSRDAAPGDAAPPAKAPKVERMSADAYRAAHEIKMVGGAAAAVFQSFEDAPFPQELLTAFLTAGFTAPTPIQAVSWPLALSGRDVVAVAKTGSGKTCGFLLPALMRLKAPGPVPARSMSPQGYWVSEPCSPRACVLAPTRELAQQIADEALRFATPLGFLVVCLYGGCDKAPQLHAMRAGCDLVIATPGRLNDFLEPPSGRSPPIAAHAVEFLVLDEADRMLDMGFEPQIKQILRQCKHTSKGRQTLLFTATWPKEVSALAATLTAGNAAHVRIGDNGSKLVVNPSVRQHVEVLPSDAAKASRLAALLKQRIVPGNKERCIVFCATKRKCEQTAVALRSAGFPVAGAIHGDKTQQERETALGRLRDGSRSILVATDVAARGLDIPGLTLIVVYDLGREIADYVHRVGRTGRAGATGDAYAFLTDSDAPLSKQLKGLLGPNAVTSPAFEALCNSAKANRGGGGPMRRGGGGRGGGNRFGRGGGRGGGGRGGKRW